MTTFEYANQELNKYAALVIDGKWEISLVVEPQGHPFDDLFSIEVEKGKGRIVGSNERAVLLGVYKFFYELGCRFVRPGKAGEILVKRQVEECSVRKSYAPKNRYRGVCSEGAISEENITDMVEWLPKIGMNSYFMQFVDGHLFFEKWYAHKGSSVLPPEEYSTAQSAKHFSNAVKKIKECGLIYQAVGHGWTTEPLGYTTYGDTCSKDEDIRSEHRDLFALVKGKRGFYQGKPGDTQLCYSNPKARAFVTDAIVNYLKDHPEVDILHFWEADGMSNHCECEACQKRLPSEWYVTMLNELDEKLTKEGLATKIVFLIYCDLLFPPKDERLQNPDRFIMMYAPIARDYTQELYTEEHFAKAKQVRLDFVRNGNRHPKTGGEYLYFLNGWQDKITSDSFAFDYHLMTFLQGGDPSSLKISRTIFEDMKNLHEAGLNGNVSCQLQRIFLPSALPNYIMAEGLFGTERTFEEIAAECLQAEYGEQWKAVYTLLSEAEAFYLSDEVRKGGELADRIAVVDRYETAIAEAEATVRFTGAGETEAQSLRNLEYFLELQTRFIAAYRKKLGGKSIAKEREALNAFIDDQEIKVQPYEDSLFRKEGMLSWL